MRSGTSDLCQKATYASAAKEALLDHLVGLRQQRGRHGEPECFRRLQVDDQLVFGRRLHRKVNWLLAPEDAINVRGRTPEHIDGVDPEGRQAARFGKIPSCGATAA